MYAENDVSNVAPPVPAPVIVQVIPTIAVVNAAVADVTVVDVAVVTASETIVQRALFAMLETNSTVFARAMVIR